MSNDYYIIKWTDLTVVTHFELCHFSQTKTELDGVHAILMFWTLGFFLYHIREMALPMSMRRSRDFL